MCLKIIPKLTQLAQIPPLRCTNTYQLSTRQIPLDASQFSVKHASTIVVFPCSINSFTPHKSCKPENGSWFILSLRPRVRSFSRCAVHLSTPLHLLCSYPGPNLSQLPMNECIALQASTHGPLGVGLNVTAGAITMEIGSCSVPAHRPQ